ncbi:MAG: hypothetical protein ACJ76L_00125 [Conexibacter sp.]
MKHVRVASAAILAAAIAAALFASTASAVLPQTLTLNLNNPRATFSDKLTSGKWHVVVAAGTGSYFKPAQWTHPILRHHRRGIVCGTPESAPMFPTAGPTGAVGFDPETMFARLTTRRKCTHDPLPRTSRRFQLNSGNGFRHPTTLTGRYTVPRGDHTYSYPVLGLRRRLSVRVKDRVSWDNYGAFHVTLRAATDGDCASRQWHNFVNSAGNQVFADQAACEAAL